jgi:hypothetical protein
MKMTMVRYRVKADRATENERLVAAVYEELHQTPPSGLHYGTFRAPDGVSFVHMAVVEPGLEPHPLLGLPAFQRFTADIGSRCEEPPVSLELEQVGSFRFLGQSSKP